MKLPYEEFVNRLYERGSQVRIVTAQGVHASLQENFRSSWRNWKGGLLTRCGHQLRCPNPTYARLFLLSLFFFFFSNHPPPPFFFLFFFFYPTILLHLFISFISLDISYFSFFFLLFPPPPVQRTLTLSIFSSRLEKSFTCITCACTTRQFSPFSHFDPIVT